MSYPSGPGGYGGGQGPSSQGYGQQPQGYGGPPAPGQGTQGKGLPFYLTMGVIALGILNFLLGFTPYISGASAEFGGESISVNQSTNFFQTNGLLSISLLLAAALVAALGLLPKQVIPEGVVSSLALVGFLSLLFQLFSLPSQTNLGWGLILVLVLSFLQAALAIAALLFSAEVIKPPQPKQQQQYGYYGPGGGYGQAPQSQPYYGAGPGPGSYQPQPPPSQPPQQHNQW